MIPILKLREYLDKAQLLEEESDQDKVLLLTSMIRLQDELLTAAAKRADRMRAVRKALGTELDSMADPTLAPAIRKPPWYTERCADIDSVAIDLDQMRKVYTDLENMWQEVVQVKAIEN